MIKTEFSAPECQVILLTKSQNSTPMLENSQEYNFIYDFFAEIGDRGAVLYLLKQYGSIVRDIAEFATGLRIVYGSPACMKELKNLLDTNHPGASFKIDDLSNELSFDDLLKLPQLVEQLHREKNQLINEHEQQIKDLKEQNDAHVDVVETRYKSQLVKIRSLFEKRCSQLFQQAIETYFPNTVDDVKSTRSTSDLKVEHSNHEEVISTTRLSKESRLLDEKTTNVSIQISQPSTSAIPNQHVNSNVSKDIRNERQLDKKITKGLIKTSQPSTSAIPNPIQHGVVVNRESVVAVNSNVPKHTKECRLSKERLDEKITNSSINNKSQPSTSAIPNLISKKSLDGKIINGSINRSQPSTSAISNPISKESLDEKIINGSINRSQSSTSAISNPISKERLDEKIINGSINRSQPSTSAIPNQQPMVLNSDSITTVNSHVPMDADEWLLKKRLDEKITNGSISIKKSQPSTSAVPNPIQHCKVVNRDSIKIVNSNVPKDTKEWLPKERPFEKPNNGSIKTSQPSTSAIHNHHSTSKKRPHGSNDRKSNSKNEKKTKTKKEEKKPIKTPKLKNRDSDSDADSDVEMLQNSLNSFKKYL